ncbi:7400_t:CDS:2 [Paraglomus brasilianum]|uniref:7400_t:CDS:1 n=1 Tax=Paraglomus brasilianum TaxID=144538 RepID=A0A9N9CPD4_9GLOM|nr:7400_t:CDS:2 [Paraglomus brasilianum]
MSKAEIGLKIETLLEQMSESVQKKYGGFKSKRRDELLKILEVGRLLFKSDNEFENSMMVCEKDVVRVKIEMQNR